MGCPACERSRLPVVYARAEVPDGNAPLRALCKTGFKTHSDFILSADNTISVDIFTTDITKAAQRVLELKASGWDGSEAFPAWAQWWGIGRVSPSRECASVGVTKPWHTVEGYAILKKKAKSIFKPKPIPGPVVKNAPSGSIMTLDRGTPPIMIIGTGIPGLPAQPAVYQYRSKGY